MRDTETLLSIFLDVSFMNVKDMIMMSRLRCETFKKKDFRPDGEPGIQRKTPNTGYQISDQI